MLAPLLLLAASAAAQSLAPTPTAAVNAAPFAAPSSDAAPPPAPPGPLGWRGTSNFSTCAEADLRWSGGAPPYRLTVAAFARPPNATDPRDAVRPERVLVERTEETNTTWIVDYAPGTWVRFSLQSREQRETFGAQLVEDPAAKPWENTCVLRDLNHVPTSSAAPTAPPSSSDATPTSSRLSPLQTLRPSTTESAAEGQPEDKGSPTGAIVGGVLGGIAGAIVLVALVWYHARRKGKAEVSRMQANTSFLPA